MRQCRLTVSAKHWNVGFQLTAESSASFRSRIELGLFESNKTGVHLMPSDPHAVNENTFYGGRFLIFGGDSRFYASDPDNQCAVKLGDGGRLAVTDNFFLKPDFNSAFGTNGPILDNARRNIFRACRFERPATREHGTRSGPWEVPIARFLNSSYGNEIEAQSPDEHERFFWISEDRDPSEGGRRDQQRGWTNRVFINQAFERENALIPVLKDSSFEHAYNDGTHWHVPGFAFLGRVANGQAFARKVTEDVIRKVESGLIYEGSDTTQIIGVKVRFIHRSRKIAAKDCHVARTRKQLQGGPFLWAIKCFDRHGNALFNPLKFDEFPDTGIDPEAPPFVLREHTPTHLFEDDGETGFYIVRGVAASPPFLTHVTDGLSLRFHDEVESFFIGLVGPHQPPGSILDGISGGFQIYYKHWGAPLIVELPYDGIKETPERLYASQFPAATQFEVAAIVYNDSPRPGSPSGWMCVNRKDSRLTEAANAGATRIRIDSTVDLRPRDVIGIRLDNDSFHWTTIRSIDPEENLVRLPNNEGIPAGRNAPVGAQVFTNRWLALARLSAA